MNAMRRVVWLWLLLAWLVNAEADFVPPLKEAKTREELINHFGTAIGFGPVEKWEFTTGGRQLLVFVYCPYSGRAACLVLSYYYRESKVAWVLFMDKMLEPTTGLSAEIG